MHKNIDGQSCLEIVGARKNNDDNAVDDKSHFYNLLKQIIDNKNLIEIEAANDSASKVPEKAPKT